MNRNVLNWLTGEVPKARHALALTHNINFLFVQSVLLPKLRAVGDPRLTIFADAGCAAVSWRQDQDLISGLGVQYRVVPVDLGPWRRFHPKALLLASDVHAALAIGSGNLTHGGMGANREAWVFGTSKNEGATRIAALREYLRAIVNDLPLADPLREVVDALFDTGQEWAAGLPPPGGLAVAPAPTPIIDQLAASAGQVRSVTVLAPYFDDNADALREIAHRFQAPVSALLQPGRAGLWAKALDNLPPQVKLKSVQDPAEKPPFIHAKMLALHRDADVLLAVGSANCSKAALLSGPQSGNAELMAWSAVSQAQFDALLSDLRVTEEVPPLPSERPSSDWDDETSAEFRVLAARQEGGELQVAFTPQRDIQTVTVIGEGAWPVSELDASAGVARLDMPVRLRSLKLAAALADGTVIESPTTWVDDEASLSAPATLRRVLKRAEEAADGGANATRAYGALLEVFHEYLRDPEAAGRRLQRGKAHGPPAAYDPAAVFDEGFGRGLAHLPHAPSIAPVSACPLRVIEMLFGLTQQRERPPTTDSIYGTHEQTTEGTDVEAPDTDLLPDPPIALDPKIGAAVGRAAAQIERALLNPAFVSGRSPTLLSADLGLAATILVMGLSARHLDVDTFRGITRRLWSHLFFGRSGQAGAIPARIAALADSKEFLAEFATPRLAATLSLWCCTEWGTQDETAHWFRLSAAALQARWPTLFAAADPDAMVATLHDIGAALLPQNEQAACVNAWRDVVRDGMALDLLRISLESGSSNNFSIATVSGWLEPTDLVWAGRTLAFPTARTRHDASANITVSPLGGATDRKFKGAFVRPVRALLNARALPLPPAAVDDVERLVKACEAARRPR